MAREEPLARRRREGPCLRAHHPRPRRPPVRACPPAEELRRSAAVRRVPPAARAGARREAPPRVQHPDRRAPVVGQPPQRRHRRRHPHHLHSLRGDAAARIWPAVTALRGPQVRGARQERDAHALQDEVAQDGPARQHPQRRPGCVGAHGLGHRRRHRLLLRVPDQGVAGVWRPRVPRHVCRRVQLGDGPHAPARGAPPPLARGRPHGERPPLQALDLESGGLLAGDAGTVRRSEQRGEAPRQPHCSMEAVRMAPRAL
mmetsp:Transcript_25980/g.61776  ORF Transcript_25980/g.61776 Transcript_25980/m.61776 type:complete len:258 (-) Transcript_25980:2142-2915(-)